MTLPQIAEGHYVTVIAEAHYANGEIGKRRPLLYDKQNTSRIVAGELRTSIGNPGILVL